MHKLPYIMLFSLIVATMSSCQAVDLVFHAGAWSGVIFVVLLTIVVVWIIARTMGKRRKNDWTKP